jgi:FkbM family methyltransferase
VSKHPWALDFQGYSICVSKSGPGALIYYQGASEPETAKIFRRLVKPEMTVFDIGAHFGEYVLIAHASGATQIHAFEPNREIFNLLSENVVRNSLPKTTLNNCAAFDCNGKLLLEQGDDPATCFVQKPISRAQDGSLELVRSLKLDTYCSDRKIRPDVIKIDVEGAELPVLKGARNTLRGHAPPILVIEVSWKNSAKYDYTPAQLFDFLARRGFQMYQCSLEHQLRPVRLDSMQKETANIIASKSFELLKRALSEN